MPKLSIIIATYNSEKTIDNAIKSIRNLKFKDWECIVVDGKSKDNTISLVERHSLEDKRIWFISEPDKGIYDAFNKGWKLANGEWIYYLGSDDMVLPDGLGTLISQRDNADILYGKFLTSSHAGRRHLTSGHEIKDFRGGMANHQTIIMKRDIIENVGGFDETYRFCADYDLVQKLAGQKHKFKYVNTFVAIFNSEGATGVGFEQFKEAYRIDRKYSYMSNFVILKRLIKNYKEGILQKKIKYPIMEVLLFLFPTYFAGVDISQYTNN